VRSDLVILRRSSDYAYLNVLLYCLTLWILIVLAALFKGTADMIGMLVLSDRMVNKFVLVGIDVLQLHIMESCLDLPVQG
jgi:hypothetical protein